MPGAFRSLAASWRRTSTPPARSLTCAEHSRTEASEERLGRAGRLENIVRRAAPRSRALFEHVEQGGVGRIKTHQGAPRDLHQLQRVAREGRQPLALRPRMNLSI